METPQIEDGFTRIAHKTLENLCKINLSSYQTRVLFAIIRKTYGWNKKEDFISISQLVEMTGIHKAHVSRTKKELLQRKLVTASGNKIGFQKNSAIWQELPSQVTIKKVTNSGLKVTNSGISVTSSGNKKLPRQADTIYIKDNITKDTYTKDIGTFLQMFSQVNPSYKNLFKNKTERASAERLLKQYGMGKITNLMGQLPAIIQKPYAPSITTPYQLEVKMGTLIAFMQKEKNKVNKFSVTKV